MRKKEFFLKDAKTQDQPADSRFGLRPKKWASNESPSIFTYSNPGKGVQGEHQN
jgi:hypothetical protein